MTGRERGVRWGRIWPAAYSLVLALIVVGPLLGPGYLLLRDGVSTPRSYPTDSALGLGDAAPRAVPQDWLLATVSTVVDGGIVVKVILVGALWAAGWGAAVLARRLLGVSLGPQLVAATIAVWNPYVAERLLQGHWSLMAGYAALPWTVLAARRIRLGTAEPSPATTRSDGHSGFIRANEPHRPDEHAPSSEPAGPNEHFGPDEPGTTNQANTTTGPNEHHTPAGPNNHRGPDEPGRAAASREPGRGGADETARSDKRSAPSESARSNELGGPGGPGERVPAWLGLGGCLAAAGLTPTGALLAGCVALVVVGRRNLLGTLGLWCIASAPWLVAAALSGAGAEPSDPAGITAFAARAEPGLGTLGSLAGLGGIWNSQAVPGSRTTLFALVGTVVLLLIVASGIRRVAAPGEAATRYIRRALLILAAAAIFLPALGATGWGLDLGRFLVTRIPGAGLFRDTQKYVALAMPAFALCAAAGCRAIATMTRSAHAEPTDAPPNPAAGIPETPGSARAATGDDRSTGTTGLVAAAFIALLIVVLPDLAWGVGGAMRAVRYPAAWHAVAQRMDGRGDVAVLPAGMFREFPYSGRVPVLDPAPRMLPRDVLQTGELPVRGGTVAGEGTRARVVQRLLLSGAGPRELAEHGVGWVLVERTSPGPLGDSQATSSRLTIVYSDHDLSLYRVPHPHHVSMESRGLYRSVAITAHLAWAVLLLAGAGAAVYRRLPGRRLGRATRPDR